MRRKKSSKADAIPAFLRPEFLRMEAAPIPRDAEPTPRRPVGSLLNRLLARSPLLTALILWKGRVAWLAWYADCLRSFFPDAHDAETRQTPAPRRARRR